MKTLALFVVVALTPAVFATPEACERLQTHTVKVARAGGGYGSGVSYGRFVLTAAHVADGCESFTVQTFSGASIPAKVHKCGTPGECDVAVLELADGVSLPRATLSVKKPRVGERVYTVGSPLGSEWFVAEGIIGRVGQKFPALGNILDQTSAHAAHGSSGGGVWCQTTGDLLGLIVGGRDYGQALYIPAREVLRFLCDCDGCK